MELIQKATLVVLDTSVIITALCSPRENYETAILHLGQEGKIIFAFTEKTFQELKNTLQKTYLKTNISPSKIAKFIAWYKYNGRLFKVPDHSSEVISRDKNDDIFLHLAIAANSKFIITTDKDLLVLKTYGNTKIVTAKEFLEMNNY